MSTCQVTITVPHPEGPISATFDCAFTESRAYVQEERLYSWDLTEWEGEDDPAIGQYIELLVRNSPKLQGDILAACVEKAQSGEAYESTY